MIKVLEEPIEIVRRNRITNTLIFHLFLFFKMLLTARIFFFYSLIKRYEKKREAERYSIVFIRYS